VSSTQQTRFKFQDTVDLPSCSSHGRCCTAPNTVAFPHFPLLVRYARDDCSGVHTYRTFTTDIAKNKLSEAGRPVRLHRRILAAKATNRDASLFASEISKISSRSDNMHGDDVATKRGAPRCDCRSLDQAHSAGTRGQRTHGCDGFGPDGCGKSNSVHD
jgi:hypothetical protein